MNLLSATGLAGLILGSLSALSQVPPPGFSGAKWIWYSREPMPITTAQSFPGGANYFRAGVTLPDPAQLRSAEVIVTADNLFSLYLNGELAGESEADNSAWGRPKRFDVAHLLVSGHNVVAIEAINTMPGPAGLLLKLVAHPVDGPPVELVTDDSWKSTDHETPGWEQSSFDDEGWRAVHVAGDFGVAPWGQVAANPTPIRAGGPLDERRQQVRHALEDLKESARLGVGPGPRPPLERTPPADYPWPDAIVFVGDDCSLYRPANHTGTSYDSLTVTTFNPHHSRAYPEHDLPAPVKVGRKLMALRPARPGASPTVLLDAGEGALGAPSVSFDGRWIYFSMARAGEAFFHLYRLSADGDQLERLTDGPFHDIDPAELPDGRIVFTSTRIGTFEEYHGPPSRALFVMPATGGGIRPLTHTFIFDNEPRILADGRILFIRSDNFFDRGKVETLLHAVHPDGTGGYTVVGLDLGPEYGNRLRAFNCGSPAPLPDGRVAFVTGSSIAVAEPGTAARDWRHLRIEAADVAALPDGRLLCTVPGRTPLEVARNLGKRPNPDHRFEQLALVDPDREGDRAVILFDSGGDPIHSPVFLGPRPRPPQLVHKVSPQQAEDLQATGVLFCQNVRLTQHTTAGWDHVRAIRVLAGKGLTVRSSHSYIVHAGSEVTELGTVPLAPDGSFAVEVPADTAIAFQAVDAEGRSELNEMSWIYVRPGETRGCVGCHQPRQVAPPHNLSMPLAMLAKPLRLLGQGEPHRFRGNNAAVTGLMELQFDRYREVAGLNRHSQATPDPTRGAEDVAALIAQLEQPDPGLRLSAAQRLALFRNPAAAPALERNLVSDHREIRVAAALALATSGTRESVPSLLAALDDSDPLVAQAAAIALENLTGHAPAFNAFSPPDDRKRQALAWRTWFTETDWDQIEQTLVQRLTHANRDTVRRAAVALGRIGRQNARVALRHYVARERENNPYPEWRQQHQGDGAMFNALSAANPRTLQAATRALGYLRDVEAVPLLAETARQHVDPATGNLFLAEAAVEALGRIGNPPAEQALLELFTRLPEYPDHTRWYGDHDALIACHAAPVHYLITEALDAIGSTQASEIVSHLIRSAPTDTDRALFPSNDDCETLIGRVIRRSGTEEAVVETCLAILDDTDARQTEEIARAIAATHPAWGGKPDPENRAAHILSLVCRNPQYAPRLQAALQRYRDRTTETPRVFDTGIPVVTRLPVKKWVCFFLARTLGQLADPQSAGFLIATLAESPAEAATGRPDPLGPGVLFLHNELTPCWRAAVAWALGRMGDPRAVPVLLEIVGDLDNATDTRHAAAEALGRIAHPASLPALRQLALDYPEFSTRRALLKASATLQPTPRLAAQHD
ncbi:MAG: HEAT repeat domain-containing protein [Verrucomicrobia bacterium]|nr:HEAT repeat domain-containing protein [Verrucomicrobiota bacterium]